MALSTGAEIVPPTKDLPVTAPKVISVVMAAPLAIVVFPSLRRVVCRSIAGVVSHAPLRAVLVVF